MKITVPGNRLRMTARSGFRSLALGALAVAVLGACTPTVGVFVTRAGSGGTAAGVVAEARALGVHTLRATADVSRPSTLTQAKNLHDQGFDIVLTVRANDLGPEGATQPLDAAGIATFETQLASAIDTVHPTWVMVENEETAPKFYAGTADQYLDELRAAVEIGHAKGVKVTDGGLTTLSTLVWDHLRAAGDPGADDYLRGASGRTGAILRAERLIANPDLLRTDPSFSVPFATVSRLVDGFRSIDLDAVDFHWYGPSADALGRTVDVYRDLTARPVLTTEIGQFDDDPTTVTAFLDALTVHRAVMVLWFDTDGDPAIGLHDAPGVLRPNGVTFATWIADHT
jgi:hypothetical protein